MGVKKARFYDKNLSLPQSQCQNLSGELRDIGHGDQAVILVSLEDGFLKVSHVLIVMLLHMKLSVYISVFLCSRRQKHHEKCQKFTS